MIRLTFYRADGSKDMYHYANDDDYAVTTHLMQESLDDSVTIEIKIVEGQLMLEFLVWVALTLGVLLVTVIFLTDN